MTTQASENDISAVHHRAFAALEGDLATNCYIGGEWRPSSDGSHIEVADPARGETFTQVANGTLDDATAAVDAASGALAAWGRTAPRERSEILAGPSSS